MTIKEKAKELSGMFSYEARTNEYCRECTQQACEMMAHWVVNKAVEWLDHNRPIGTRDPEWEDTINEFKKAMEDESR